MDNAGSLERLCRFVPEPPPPDAPLPGMGGRLPGGRGGPPGATPRFPPVLLPPPLDGPWPRPPEAAPVVRRGRPLPLEEEFVGWADLPPPPPGPWPDESILRLLPLLPEPVPVPIRPLLLLFGPPDRWAPFLTPPPPAPPRPVAADCCCADLLAEVATAPVLPPFPFTPAGGGGGGGGATCAAAGFEPHAPILPSPLEELDMRAVWSVYPSSGVDAVWGRCKQRGDRLLCPSQIRLCFAEPTKRRAFSVNHTTVVPTPRGPIKGANQLSPSKPSFFGVE